MFFLLNFVFIISYELEHTLSLKNCRFIELWYAFRVEFFDFDRFSSRILHEWMHFCRCLIVYNTRSITFHMHYCQDFRLTIGFGRRQWIYFSQPNRESINENRTKYIISISFIHSFIHEFENQLPKTEKPTTRERKTIKKKTRNKCKKKKLIWKKSCKTRILKLSNCFDVIR